MGRGLSSFDPASLRKERTAGNLSLGALGELIGVSAQQIHAYEQGRQPSPKRLSDLAEALDIAPDRLMRSGRPTLADLRLRAGYTSQQFADALGIGRATYSRLEHQGVIPRSWKTLEPKAADLLGITEQRLNQIIHPQQLPHDRTTEVDRLAAEFADQACDRRQTLRVARGDPRLRPLAVALGHPQDQVRKVLVAELTRIRHLAQQVDMAHAQAAWPEADPDEAVFHEIELKGLRRMLPSNLRSGLQLLSHRQWNTLVRAYQLYPSKQAHAESTPGLAELLVRDFMELVPAHGPASRLTAVVITDEGQEHVETNQDRYHRLYPDIRITPKTRLAEGESWRTITRDQDGNALQIGRADGGAMIIRRWTAGRHTPEALSFSAAQWSAFVGEAQQGQHYFERGARRKAAKEFKDWAEATDGSVFLLKSIFPRPR